MDIRRICPDSRLVLDLGFSSRCIFCDYDLRSATTHCPECGTPTSGIDPPEEVRHLLERPPVGLSILAEFVLYWIGKLLLPVGMFAAAAVLVFLRHDVAAFALACVALFVALGTMQGGNGFGRVWEWRRLHCPRCNAVFQVKRVWKSLPRRSLAEAPQSRTEFLALICRPCGRRYDVSVPVNH